jgi:hypothetical protein
MVTGESVKRVTQHARLSQRDRARFWADANSDGYLFYFPLWYKISFR